MKNQSNSVTAVHKIGAVSSLSGVPIPTLRVWELRYGTFTPQKSQGQHRLYTDDDVLRAGLLKRLTERGHAISSLAGYASHELNALLLQGQDASRWRTGARMGGQSASMAIVGVALASRIESKKFTLGFIDQHIKVTNLFDDMTHALGHTFERPVPFLLVKANSLHAGIQDDIHRLAKNCKAIQVMVVYRFGQESVIQMMKRSGMMVRKEPASDSDLADLINSALLMGTEKESSGLVVGNVIPPRKYSELTLNRVANTSTNVLCECPRHVAEIIAQLASFEQYSHECLNKSAEDAHLHAYLSSVSGSARALFESALEMVAKHEGITLEARAQWRWRGVDRPPFAETPAPGQVSVWDFPRPPALVPESREILVHWGETLVARTQGAWAVRETAHPPSFYVPLADVERKLLRPAGEGSFCEWKGPAHYWSLVDGVRQLPRVAWSYPRPFAGAEPLAQCIAFYAHELNCSVGGARVVAQSGGFYGGWITPDLAGPFKGDPGSNAW